MEYTAPNIYFSTHIIYSFLLKVNKICSTKNDKNLHLNFMNIFLFRAYNTIVGTLLVKQRAYRYRSLVGVCMFEQRLFIV